MVKTTKNYKIELNNDLLMIKDLQGNLLKGMAVPAFQAVDKFKEMVKNVLRERSIKAISKAQEKNLADIERVLELYKKAKGGNKSYNEKNLIKVIFI